MQQSRAEGSGGSGKGLTGKGEVETWRRVREVKDEKAKGGGCRRKRVGVRRDALRMVEEKWEGVVSEAGWG